MASKIWSAITQAKAVIPSPSASLRTGSIEESRCISLRYHHRILRPRKLSGLRTTAPANPTAAEDDVAIVKHRCLPWSHGPLRSVQPHMGAPVFERRQRSACPWMAITELRRPFDFFAVAG